MDARLDLKDGVSCSLNLLSRAGYIMPNLDASDWEEEVTCNYYLCDSVHANSLRRLMPAEDKPSVYRDWAIDPFSLQIEDDCPACGSYSLDYLRKLLGGSGD